MDRGVGVVEGVALAAGFAVADAVELVGAGLDAGLARLGPVGRWAGRSLMGMTDLGGALVSGAVGIVVGTPAGVVRVLVGLLLVDRPLVRRGAIGVVAPVAGAVVVLLGRLVAAVQRVVGAEAPARPLTVEEEGLLREVFGSSVGYRVVRVVQGRSGAFGTNARPFTLGSTIYLKDVDPVARADVLVHEVVHVWQHQHEGPRYAAEALGAQVVYGWKGRGAYDWEADLTRGRTAWRDFNKEAQGSFVQHLWAGEAPAVGRPELAAETLAEVRGWRTWRPSARLTSR